MNKYNEIAIAYSSRHMKNKKLSDVLMKTLENIAFERAGQPPPHDDAEIFTEITAIKSEIRESAAALSDDAALIAIELFEPWDADKAYKAGDRFVYNGNLYRCKADNPVNPTWTPDVTHDYYEPVAKPSEDGTLDNPITSVEGMEYEVGKYYSEGDKVYLCTREGANEGDKFVLYHAPSALVGHYFEEAVT